MSGEGVVFSGSQEDYEAEAYINRDDMEVVPDVAMMDAVSTEVIKTVHLPSVKEYSTPSAFAIVDAIDFATLGGAS